MASRPSTPTIALVSLACVTIGCFDPVAPGGDAGSDTSGDTNELGDDSTSNGAATSESSEEGLLDSTGANDEPPEIVSFTIDGSASPPELEHSGLILLEVDAVDDIGIDRVEFREGEKLLATVTSPPFRHELLVSSATNGTRLLSATAYDSADQSDVSDVIPLSVNIAGGMLLELRESIATVSAALRFTGVPKVTSNSNGRIVLTSRIPLDPFGNAIYASLYDPSLSLIWGHEYASPNAVNAGESGYYRPSMHSSDTQIVFGGVRRNAGEDAFYTIYVLDSATGLLDSTHVTRGQDDFVPGHQPVVPTPEGWLYATVDRNRVGKLSGDLSTEEWRTEPLGNTILHLAATPSGGVVATLQGQECSASEDICIRSFSSSGDTLWTRVIAQDESLYSSYWGTQPAVSPSGTVAVPYNSEKANHILVFDDTGKELPPIELPEGSLPFEIAFTDFGTVVVAASDSVTTPFDAMVAHYELTGAEIWVESFSIGASDSGATGITTTGDGRLYVAGFAGSGSPTESLTDAWIAEIRL